MKTYGYFIFNAEGKHLTKNLSYNKNGFWNHKHGYVFTNDEVEYIKNIFLDRKDKPIYKQEGFYDDEAGESFKHGILISLWSDEEVSQEELFLIELKLLTNKYFVSIEEDFDWVWGSDGDEHKISAGYWFKSDKNDILIKINNKIFNE